MFGPAIACLLVRLLRREGFSDAGLPFIGPGVRGIGRLYLAAYGVPLVLPVVGVGLALLLGVQQCFLKDPLFLASSVFVKKPERIIALSLIMVLCPLLCTL